MQGDIFMLDETTAMQAPASATTSSASKASNTKLQTTVAQVAIYNEDDLSHLLFADSTIEPTLHHHHHHHHHYDGSLTPLSSAPASSGTHTPLFSDHSDSESAVFEDGWESAQHQHEAAEDQDLDFEIPPSPVPRRRGGTMCSSDDDFEWPVFLGRQADELAPSLRRRSSACSSASHSEQRATTAATAGYVPSEQHASSIEGPLMALWPAAPFDFAEWSERFYE
ncbi:hypothetical protein SLS62_005921 [Diatrype stigma]|uniref:Uncharacterized protein n=1 Tax=Diatrype stigma TaxID=117547 RepID=A0AAN9YRR8_9PEZI